MNAMLHLVVESWIWYGLAVGVAVARFTSRYLTLQAIKKYQADDWIMAGALCTYTTFLVSINIVADHNSNLLAPGSDIVDLTPEDIRSRIYGSKMILVVEICQCITIWAVKACLLIMYYRLTIAMRENWFVKILAGYTAFGFVFMMVFYLGVWCRPFSDYWALPTQKQCSAATNHLITNATFNLSSDLGMLVLALQMFVRSKLPIRRKIILCGIFGLGAFVILAAVLNKYYSFDQPFGSQWTFWYVRESSTALLVANLPYTWTLLRRIFKLRAFDPDKNSNNTSNSRLSPVQLHPRTTLPGLRTGTGSTSTDDTKLSPSEKRKPKRASTTLTDGSKRSPIDFSNPFGGGPLEKDFDAGTDVRDPDCEGPRADNNAPVQGRPRLISVAMGRADQELKLALQDSGLEDDDDIDPRWRGQSDQHQPPERMV